ncbi:MAG: STAS domain-containing protein [Candidatus Eremiobacteraeota bacterium]|nr:STAS domain-containing protein [Candidatus Eremiobacteraeota bacterium]
MTAIIKESSINPDYTILKLKHKLDTVSAEVFETQINELITKGKTNIIIDFEESNYLSSMGLRVLFSASRLLNEQNRRLILINVGPTVMKVINIADCADLFEIFESEEKALASPGSNPTCKG